LLFSRSVDFEPPLPSNPQHTEPKTPNQPTFEDGLAFARFLDALAKAMHALPGRRRLLTVDTGSVAGACWSIGPLDHGKRNHSWDLLPCPWIARFFNFDALASSDLDIIIPMDSYTANSTEFPYITWLYQKYLPTNRIGWGLYPTQRWPDAESEGPFQAAADEIVASRMDAFEAYGSRWISMFRVNPGSPGTPNITALTAKWRPWLPRLRQFIQGKTDDTHDTSSTSPVPLGRRKHLFVDDFLLSSWDNASLRLRLNPPVVRPDPVLTADAPWEKAAAGFALGGSVLGPSEPDGPLRMWYNLQANTSDPNVSYIPAMSFATSLDGITWKKPLLSATLFAGTTQTNVVAWGINGSNVSAPCPPNVWLDPNAPPHERYKTQGEFYVTITKCAPNCKHACCLTPTCTCVERSKVFRFSASPDGIHWHHLADLTGMGSIDSFTTVRWSPASKRYQMYMRDKEPAPQHHYRCIRRLLSRTASFPMVGTDWVEQKVILCPDAVDNSTHGGGADAHGTGLPPMDFYGAVPFSVSGAPQEMLLMLVNRFWHTSGTCDVYSCTSGGPGTHTDALMVSRDDGATWSWVGGRDTLLGTGTIGSWRSKFVWSMRDPVVVGDRWLLFFWGQNNAEMAHAKGQIGLPPRLTGLGVAEGRIDGLGSLEAGYATPGSATTVPILFNGTNLTVNVDCGGHGALRVEVQDANGVPSPCFTLARATPIWGNGLAVRVGWAEGSGGTDEARGGCHDTKPWQNWAHLKGVARLRFVLEDCKLFAFQFV
jgi:hypothetical protein